MQHTGKAIVFDGPDDLKARIDEVEADASSILVLRNCGPKGYPGMAEIGNLPVPRRLLEAGITDGEPEHVVVIENWLQNLDPGTNSQAD